MANRYGPWETVRQLSEGGQSKVYLVSHADDPDDKKRVLKRYTGSPERREAEVQAALELRHPNVAEYVDHDLEADKPYLVTKYYEGGDLEDTKLSEWTTRERLRFFLRICDAVAYAHTCDVIHRDLKPANIFLKNDGRTPVVGDFGICFLDPEGERVTVTDEAVGPTNYVAPELEDGRVAEVGAHSDVYSLGKLLYYIFEGRIFAREKHRTREWSLTSDDKVMSRTEFWKRSFVNELLDDCIAQKPGDRFPDARPLRRCVDRAISRIERGTNVTDVREVQLCNFCGKGEYEPVVATEEMELQDIPYTGGAKEFNINQPGRSGWLVLSCTHCGHVQYFRTDILQPNPWKGVGELNWSP